MSAGDNEARPAPAVMIATLETVTVENAKEVIEQRMADLVDLIAVFPGVPIDPRAWSQLLVYAPRPADEDGARR